MIKAIVEITYHKIGKYTYELLDNELNTITLGGYQHGDCVSEEVSNFWEDYINNLDFTLEYDVVYKTVLEVTYTYHTDYWGEVACNYETEVLHHGVAYTIDDRPTDKDTLLFELK